MNRKTRTIATSTPETTAFPNNSADAPVHAEAAAGPTTKLAMVIALLQAGDGATLDSLCEATGWQSHSVRGAMAGALRRKGYVVTSTRCVDGLRRYRIAAAA
jgi:hypothetical protein